MLSQVHPAPLQLQIPRFITDYTSTHISPLDRPKPSASQSYYTAAVVEPSLSPARSDSPRDIPDKSHRLPSPASPQEHSRYFEIVRRPVGAFDSNICPADIYENSNRHSSSSQHHQYPSVSGASSSAFLINSTSKLRGSDTVVHYLSDSPSPVDVQQPPSSSHPSSASPSQDRFPHSPHSFYPGLDRTTVQSTPNPEGLSLKQMDKYPTLEPPTNLLDHRRMSEPAILSSTSLYHDGSSTDAGSASRQSPLDYEYCKSPSSMYITPALHRGASTGSLRDLRQQHYQYPPMNSGWKPDRTANRQYEQVSSLDEPLSPFQPTFSGGLASPTSMSYSSVHDSFYGPSPPGTGTSTTSSGPLSAGLSGSLPHDHLNPFRSSQRISSTHGHSPTNDTDRKNYSFIALPGNAVKKRPRRRYDEIERLYQCSWPDCAKAYGTLNHLNAHVTMQKHGAKRSPSEFKELRKQWRKAKKEAEGNSTLESLRRASFNGGRDYEYDGGRFAFSNSPQRPPFLDFPHAMPMNQSYDQGQYSDGSNGFRCGSYPREGDAMYADHSRSQFTGSLSSSWSGSSSLSSRTSVSDYLPSSHAFQTQLPQLMVTESGREHRIIPMPSSPRRMSNTLPTGSTLLTPLPIYSGASLLLPTLEHTPAFTGHGLDIGDSDNSRPSTGYTNTSTGMPSCEDYDPHLM